MTTEIKNNHTLPNLKDKSYGGAWSIHDIEQLEFVKNTELKQIKVMNFLDNYYNWCKEPHKIHGIEKYKNLSYSNGTTEVFDKFYQRHMHRRLRLWRGEYYYHQIQAKLFFKDKFEWIEDSPIMENDVVVVSMPFSDTGLIPNDYNFIMQQCCSKNVPVMIDMAYLNITCPMTYNIDFDCITTLATSLSKYFPVEFDRIGMRMERNFIDDTLNAYTTNHTPYVNQRSVSLGNSIINNFHPLYIYKKYKDKQEQICTKLNLIKSNVVQFGIDNKDLYPQYNRGGKTNRLCFSRIWDKRYV